MAWKRTIGGIAPVCLLLAGCTMGNSVTVTDHVTIGKGQNLDHYQLVNVDPQGRAEFRTESGDSRLAHILAAPGQTWGATVESKHKSFRYDYQIESTDPAKQQVTVLTKITTRK